MSIRPEQEEGGGSPIDMVVNTRENKDISITAVQTISPTYNTIHFPFAASNAVEIALPNHISRQESVEAKIQSQKKLLLFPVYWKKISGRGVQKGPHTNVKSNFCLSLLDSGKEQQLNVRKSFFGADVAKVYSVSDASI